MTNKVLIVEDDFMIADMTEEMLIDHGYTVCGIARTVDEALSLARQHEPNLMVLDLRLANGGLGTEVVAQLGSIDSVGILYATGNKSQIVLSADDGHACIEKPFSCADLIEGLAIVANIVAQKSVRPPFPANFQLLPLSPNADRGVLHD